MYSNKYQSNVALRALLNSHNHDDSTLEMMKEGTGLDYLDKANKVLEPWEVLLDLGHYATYNYNYLLNCLTDFKDINEKVMARTILHLSLNHTGYDDLNSRVVYTLYESNKKNQPPSLKDQSEKKTVMTWSVDNLSRLFRELYSGLNWFKIFEALSELKEDTPLDSKGFATFLQIFNKSKPQNLAFPLHIILEYKWVSPALQLNFIENCIQVYLEKKDKTINFLKTSKRQETIEEI